MSGHVYAGLLELDKRLVAAKFPALPPWWRDVIGGFYQSGKRELVLRVGRRGGKSSTLCRIAVAEALWGGHRVPPGDIGVVAIVSANRDQATDRLRTIETILTAMGMRKDADFVANADRIELRHRPVAFRTLSATRGGSVGFTAICVICDELALWHNDETGANPATDILKWLRPTMATQRTAKMFLSSSPFSTLDAHHEAFERGNTPEQTIAWAPSWVANPSITEAETHSLEPDTVEWTRQYKAEPVASGASTFFDPGAIDAAVDASQVMPRVALQGDVVTAGGDFGFRSDCSALAIVHRTGDTLRVGELVELKPEIGSPLLPSKVVGTFVEVLKRHGPEYVMSDGHYRMAISELLESQGLHFTCAPEGQRGIGETYIRTRVLLHGGQLKLPKHDRLVRQLKEVVSRPTPGGAVSVSSPRKSGGGHGDLVSALVLACWQREGHTVPETRLTFGTPEYWQHLKSREYLDREDARTLEREEQEARRAEDDENNTPWWDRAPA